MKSNMPTMFSVTPPPRKYSRSFSTAEQRVHSECSAPFIVSHKLCVRNGAVKENPVEKNTIFLKK